MEFTVGTHDEYSNPILPFEPVKNPNGLLTAQMYRQAGDHISDLAVLQGEVQSTATVAQTAIQLAIAETARADNLKFRLETQSAAYNEVSEALERSEAQRSDQAAAIAEQNTSFVALTIDLLGTKMQLSQERSDRAKDKDRIKSANEDKLREANEALTQERAARIAAEQAAQRSASDVQSLQQTNTQLSEEIGPLRIQAARVPALKKSLVTANSQLERVHRTNIGSERTIHRLRVLLGNTDPDYKPVGFLGRLKNQLTSLVQPQSK